MGGSTGLPTASTPGYGYYPVVTTWAPDVACDCLRQWIPVFKRLCQLKGYGTPPVWQCTGGDANSAGTHTRGGAVDFGGLGNARAELAREMGAWASWPRNWSGNQHTHCVLAGCPHNYPARYQLDAVKAGYNGLGSNGRAGPDPLKGSPSTYRSWSQGITWAKAQITKLEDDVTPDDIKAIAAAVWSRDSGIDYSNGTPIPASSVLKMMYDRVFNAELDARAAKETAAALKTKVEALTAAVNALPKA